LFIAFFLGVGVGVSKTQKRDKNKSLNTAAKTSTYIRHLFSRHTPPLGKCQGQGAPQGVQKDHDAQRTGDKSPSGLMPMAHYLL
jgi:hypothetical protein